MSEPRSLAAGGEPVFIHSLFRSGSTYLFEVFRRSPSGYSCYQEPLHEILLKAATTPALLEEDPAALNSRLRHTVLSRPYFDEFKGVSHELPRFLDQEMIYENFFSADPAHLERLKRYFDFLARAARSRPVFQECRTFARTPYLAPVVGGFHIYLWRNPWDQWWSHKVDPYFDLVYRLAIGAANPPPFVHALRQELSFSVRPGASLESEIDFLASHPLEKHQSYLLFYALWCYALSVNLAACRCQINIDSLSTSADYRKDVLQTLERQGITGLDFSGCAIPQNQYDESERRFFADIERKAESILQRAGTPLDLAAVRELREKHAPAVPATAPLQSATTHRAQILRMSGDHAARVRQLQEQLEGERLARQRLEDERAALRRSLPWRLAAPLRFIYRTIRKATSR